MRLLVILCLFRLTFDTTNRNTDNYGAYHYSIRYLNQYHKPHSKITDNDVTAENVLVKIKLE